MTILNQIDHKHFIVCSEKKKKKEIEKRKLVDVLNIRCMCQDQVERHDII